MKIYNPLQINDWEIKKFIALILSINLAAWGVIGLNAIGLQIPILRELIGFIYLALIPGFIILRALELHRLGNIETLLYAVGLSASFLMSTGLFMNMLFPFISIPRPISTLPLIITISVELSLLSVLSYIRDRNYSRSDFFDVEELQIFPLSFLCFTLLLGILGMYLMNSFHYNSLLMLLIAIIAILVVLIGFDKFIPNSLYPFALFVIAVSLFYHKSLISMYLYGWDIQHEHYIANLVVTNSNWNCSIPSDTNAMLSISILAPIFSSICGISVIWVFKIIYPMLFSLVPLGLYSIFRKQTDDRIAFFSCFFFIPMCVFSIEIIALARQEIAELFLVLLTLIMINKSINKIKRALLFIIFGFSLAVSHYGLSYIFIICLVITWVIYIITNLFLVLKERKNVKTIKNIYKSERAYNSTFILLFCIFSITWYMYISSSSAFNIFANIGKQIASNILGILNPETVEPVDIILKEQISTWRLMTKYLYLSSIFFIFIGIVKTIVLKNSETRFEKEYEVLYLANFIICLAGVIVPYFASSLNAARLYQIALIFLVPLCVIGGITVFGTIGKFFNEEKIKRNSVRIFSFYLAIFLLFSSGFICEVVKDMPISTSLNYTMDAPRFNDREISSAIWLSNGNISNPIYADVYRWLLLRGYFDPRHIKPFSVNVNQMSKNSYIYFGTKNVEELNGIVLNLKGIQFETKYVNQKELVSSKNEIYMNGGSSIYFSIN